MDLATASLARLNRECRTCGEVKPLISDHFQRHKSSAQGYRPHCKPCMNLYQAGKIHLKKSNRRQYEVEQRQARDVEREKRRAEKLEVSRLGLRKCTTCKETKSLTREFFHYNRENCDGFQIYCIACAKVYHKRHYEKDPKALRAKKSADLKRREAANPELKRLRRAREDAAAARKKKTDLTFRVHVQFSRNIRRALRRQVLSGRMGQSWVNVMGYDAKALMAHLERQFKKGMSWANYGEWHIDHIIPASSFVFSSYEDPEFKACWALSNLRPLWGIENSLKNDKRLFPL